jgi:thymidine kinase
MEHRGTLCLRIGPMYSSKSTWLNGQLTEFADKGFRVLKITHADDIRSDVETCDDAGSTHSSSYKFLSNKITAVRVSELTGVDIANFNVIGIDEAQFFTDLYDWVFHAVEKLGKHLRVVGLDGDFQKKKFGHLLDLIPISDEVVKLHASCQICLQELESMNFHGNILAIVGPFTKRLGGATEQKLIGGRTQYIPVCRYHHNL